MISGSNTRQRAAAAGVWLLAVVASLAFGSERIALPKMELGTADGTPAQSESVLPTTGKWLLAYVQPNCVPCGRLLNLLDKPDHPEIAPKLVIVFAGSREQLTASRGPLKNLAAAQWYSDASGNVWTALKLSGVPVVFGIEDRTIQWSLSGVVQSDDQIRSVLSSWVSE